MAGAAGAEDVGDGMVLAAVPNGQHHEKLLIGRNRQRHTDSESGGFSASQLPDHRQAPALTEEAQSKKWKSTWELTPKEIEKKEKKIKKRRKWERALGLPSSSSNKSSEILKHVATVNPTRISYESSRKSNSTMSTMTNGHHQDIPEDIPEEDQANGTASAPPVKPPKKSKKHQIETPTPLPPPPPWKIILETTVNTGIDSLFKFMIDNDTFFDIVTKKRYDEVASFTVTPWALPAKGPEDEDEVADAASSRLSGGGGGVVKEQRTMFYQFVQTIAFSRTTIAVEQLMTKTLSNVGHSYIVDCQAQASGAPMADSCVQHLHYRFEDASVGGEANTATRFTVLADIEWVKPCLFKGRVESETWSGMKKYYEIVELEIQDLHAQSFRPVPPNPPIQAEEQQRAETKPRKKKDAPSAPNASTSRQTQALVGGGGRGLTGETQQQQQQSTATMVGLTLVVLFVLTTMCAITFAMFKMTGTVELLSERVLMLENTINELKETAANRGHPDNYCHNPDTSDM